MKTRSCALIACLFASLFTQAQVAFNTTGASPNNSAMLDVTSTTKGVLVPRMTTAERMAIASPTTGLLVYDKSFSLFYYYNGTAWTSVTTPASEWSVNGNSGTAPGTNFLGTTDNQSLGLKSNNTLHTRIRNSGQIEILNTGRSVFLGEDAGYSEDGNNRYNTGLGAFTMPGMISATGNTAIGWLSQQTSMNDYNTTAGVFALGSAASTGVSNTALGRSAMSITTSGSYNTAFGAQCLRNNNAGSYNVCVGAYALYSNTTGIENIGLGHHAGRQNTTGNYNISIGTSVPVNNTSGSNIIALGSSTDVAVSNLSNASAIGYTAVVTQNNSVVLGGTGANAVNVGIGTTTPVSTLEITGAGSMAIKSGQVAGINNPDNTTSLWRYTSGTGSITLPDATMYANRVYMLMNQTGAILNISSYNDLGGTAQTTLNTGASIMIVSDGIAWLQIK